MFADVDDLRSNENPRDIQIKILKIVSLSPIFSGLFSFCMLILYMFYLLRWVLFVSFANFIKFGVCF